jgi:large subunit ribosomal protein L18
MKEKTKIRKRSIRKKRTRSKTHGTSKRPRLSVYRSNRYISAQLIDDDKGITIISVGEKNIRAKGKSSKKDNKLQGKVAKASELGQVLAEKALKKKIKSVVFDKGGNKYHGRVKQVAEGARKGGLKL